jgi:[ribosomal protein S5]-alanine N-acetyltransferase
MTTEQAKILNSSFSTSQLLIEPLKETHASTFYPLMQDEKIYEWISSVPPKSLESLTHHWQKLESRLSPDKTEAWLDWAVRRKSDGVYVGKLDACVTSNKIANNVGYFFFPKYWGLGLATEALKALTRHLIENDINELKAYVTEGNLASYRVLEKAGYKKSRIVLGNDTVRGKKINDVEFLFQVQI